MRRTMFLRIVAALLVALTASACGGGDFPVQPPGVPSRVDGVLIGTMTRGGQSFQALALVEGNRFMAYDLGGVSYDAEFTRDGGQVSASSLRIYAGDPLSRVTIRQVSSTAPMSASITTEGWTGSIAATSGSISFDLDYDRDTDRQDSTLGFIDGDWLLEDGTYDSDLAIAANGAATMAESNNGTATGCDGTGQVSIIDADYALYGWSVTLAGANCGNRDDLPYTGLAILSENTAPLDTLTLLVANDNYFLRLTPYRRQP